MADANLTPFEQLAGVILKVYLHTTPSTVAPAVNADPTGAGWVLLGDTDGGQTVTHGGAKTKIYDDAHQGPVKAVRPQEDPVISTMLVDMTLENYARVLSNVAAVTSAAGPPAIKTMPIKRGRFGQRYAFLFRSSIASPYGNFPAQYYLPIGEFDGEPAPAFTKDGRAGLQVDIFAIEDDTQSSGNELGVLTAQTS